jgi:hypothetical protein
VITLKSIVRRDPRVAYVVLDGEGVLYHESIGEAHIFNPTATLIWEALDGHRDLASVVDEFGRLSGAPVDVIAQDVIAAVNDFDRLGLIDVPSRDDGSEG